MERFVEQLKEDLLNNSYVIDEQSRSIENILNRMLEIIEPLNIRDANGLKNDEKIKVRDYTVIVIKTLIEIIMRNKWDFVLNHDTVMLFNGCMWVTIESSEIKRFLRDVAIKMGAPELLMRHFSSMDALYKQLLVDTHIKKELPIEDIVKINLKNGTLTINRDGFSLNGFKKEDYLTYQLPFEYDATADCPMFFAFLNKSMPDQECQNVLSEYFASIFVPWLKLEKCLMLYGDGANGKSVLAKIISAMLGHDNVTTFSLPALTSKEGYARAEIDNKLLNICTELDAKHYDVSMLKALISQEPVDARRPYGEPFNISHYAKLLFNCNVLPENIELTNAFFRRFLIVPWDTIIPENEQNKELANNIIKSELPGVLNWVLRGLTRLLQQRHFSYANKIENAVFTYRDETNTVIMYLDECGIEVGNDYHELISHVNKDYNDFCRQNRLPAVTMNELSRYLSRKGFRKQRMNKGSFVWYSKREDNGL